MQKLRNDELGRLSVAEFRNSEKLSVVIVLDNVRSGLNVGSVFRSADAFRVEAIYCCGITPVPPHRDILKSALGATESIEWKHAETTLHAIKELKEKGYTVAAVEQTVHSVKLHEMNVTGQPLAFVFGHEMDGVSQEVINHSDLTIEIPQSGTKHSLNIAVCAGIVLWEVYRKNMQK